MIKPIALVVFYVSCIAYFVSMVAFLIIGITQNYLEQASLVFSCVCISLLTLLITHNLSSD